MEERLLVEYVLVCEVLGLGGWLESGRVAVLVWGNGVGVEVRWS